VLVDDPWVLKNWFGARETDVPDVSYATVVAPSDFEIHSAVS